MFDIRRWFPKSRAWPLFVVPAIWIGGTGDRPIGAEARGGEQPAIGLASESERRFVLPEGYVIEAVATAPLVKYPLFGCFDDAGRLYVSEGTGQSVPGSELVKLNLGKITRLEDTDGDGRFDKSILFADGLVCPQGVLWHDGVVYTASHPAIWRLEDTDGDGRADQREEFVAKFNFNGNGCDIHGPFLGPDGRIYWTDGRHGYNIERPDGTRLEGLASRIWRCRTDGRELERIAGGGFDNPVEVAWTSDGEMLGTMDQGAGDCLLHYVDGGVYPEKHPCLVEFAHTGPPLTVAKRYPVELPAALCGTMRYRSNQFGPEFCDALITTHYMTHKLVRSALVRDGSTFRAEDTDFLVSTDPHLRLTDVLEDADGSLLAIDMGAWFTYGFLGNVLPRPEMLGAIYRIRRTAAAPVIDPRGNEPRFSSRTPGELVKLLDDRRPAVVDRAVAALAKLGDSAVRDLEAVVTARDRSPDARSNAIWAMCRIDGPGARRVIRTAVSRQLEIQGGAVASPGEWRVLMAAVHAIGLHRDGEAIGVLIDLLQTEHLPLRRKAVESLGRIGKPEAIPALLEVLRRPLDRFLEHAVIYALIQINHRGELRAGLADSDPRVQKGALIALDQMQDRRLTRDEVAPLLRSDDTPLQQTALDIIVRHPEWAEAAHELLRLWLASSTLTAEQQGALTGLLQSADIDLEIQRLSGAALASAVTPAATRSLVVGAMRRTRLKQAPAAWADALTQGFADPDPAFRWEVLATVRTRGWRQFDDVVREMSRDARQPAELRLAALECLSDVRQPLESDAFAFLTRQLSESAPPLDRMAAVRTLVASPLTQDQLIRIAVKSGQVNTLILRLLLPLFGRSSDAGVGIALVDALLNAAAAEALTTSELDRALCALPVEVRDRAAPLREKIMMRMRDQAAYLARLTAELDDIRGNADAGKEVFLAAKNNCFACHRAVGRGGTIGPDLTKIGQIRTRAELLESIVFPSFAVVPQYQTHTVATRDGRVATGLVVRESPDSITLRATDLAELQFPRSELDELAPSPISLMPDGLEKTLTRRQLADLLEFLCQQR